MNALLKAAAETIRGLHDKETWEIEFKGEHGGITHLVRGLALGMSREI